MHYTIANEPKEGIQLLLISYLLPESFVLASTRILHCFLTFYCCIVNPFDPYSLLNYQFFIFLVYIYTCIYTTYVYRLYIRIYVYVCVCVLCVCVCVCVVCVCVRACVCVSIIQHGSVV